MKNSVKINLGSVSITAPNNVNVDLKDIVLETSLDYAEGELKQVCDFVDQLSKLVINTIASGEEANRRHEIEFEKLKHDHRMAEIELSNSTKKDGGWLDNNESK